MDYTTSGPTKTATLGLMDHTADGPMDPNYQTCGLCPLGPTPTHSHPWITPYLIPWAPPITWLPHCQTYLILGPMDPIPLNP